MGVKLFEIHEAAAVKFELILALCDQKKVSNFVMIFSMGSSSLDNCGNLTLTLVYTYISQDIQYIHIHKNEQTQILGSFTVTERPKLINEFYFWTQNHLHSFTNTQH